MEKYLQFNINKLPQLESDTKYFYAKRIIEQMKIFQF